MIEFLLQVREGVELVNSVTSNKSETFTLLFVGIILVGVVIWRWEVRANKEDDRQEAREIAQREKDIKDSESLRVVSESTVRTANATEIMAKSVQNIEVKQRQDRRALIHIIEAVKSNSNGQDSEESQSHLEHAKNELLDH